MIGRVRRAAAVALVVLLVTACTSVAPPQPTEPPPPTPTRFIPVQLLTPRPTATPQKATATPRPQAKATATPVPTVPGTPVAAYEALQGFVVDDRFKSAIIGEELSYRVYLPPDYLKAPTRRYPVLYMLH